MTAAQKYRSDTLACLKSEDPDAGLSYRHRAVIALIQNGATVEQAERLESDIHDRAWNRSLHTDDANHAPISHSGKIYQRYYAEYLRTELAQP